MTNMTNTAYSSHQRSLPQQSIPRPNSVSIVPMPLSASQTRINGDLSLPNYLAQTPVAETTDSGAFKYLVPTNWSERDKCSLITIDRNRVIYSGSGKTDSEAATVRANEAIPSQCGIFYFEVEIVSKGRDGYIAIGFCGRSVSLNRFVVYLVFDSRLPGWELESWGYHGDDGNMFTCSGTGCAYGPTFTTGDVIGCCINFHSRTAFYTKQGTAFKDVKLTGMYPAVGCRTPGEIVEANFGEKKFVFDIELYCFTQRDKLMQQVSTEVCVSKEDVNALVCQFLVQEVNNS